MQIQLIRSATLRFDYAEKSFIIDPYLAAKHTQPSYTGTSPNPLVDLPCSPFEAITGIEMVLISHLHSDHFDPAAQDLLPKDITIFCQPQDKAEIESKGFRNVIPVADAVNWQGITITRAPCQHGTGEVLKEMGNASGFVFSSGNEPTVYWAGDTIWCKAVADVIFRTRPDVIITHSCGARWGDHVLIVMDAEQTLAVCRAAPNSTVVATHMESLDHATVTREALRKYAEANGIGPEKLLIPLDGEKIAF
jgi:L-ascorbate metabolism protein UlaG (beta-lactamase superfamily)